MGRVSEKACLREWILSRHPKRDQGEDHCWHRKKHVLFRALQRGVSLAWVKTWRCSGVGREMNQKLNPSGSRRSC